MFHVDIDTKVNQVKIKDLTHIIVYPRRECCYERYKTFSVRVRTVNGNVVRLTPVVDVFTTSYVQSHLNSGLRWDLFWQDKWDSGRMMEEILRITVSNTDHYIQISEIKLFYQQV